MTSGRALAPGGPSVHLTRLPLHGPDGELLGRDLGFSNEHPACRADVDPAIGGIDLLTRGIVNTLVEYPVTELTGDGRAMVGLSAAFVHGEVPVPFDPGTAAIRTRVGVDGDPAEVSALTALAGQGHELALDGYRWTPASQPALSAARWVVLDLLGLTDQELELSIAAGRAAGVQPIGRGATDPTARVRGLRAGIDLFLGRQAVVPVDDGRLQPQQTSALQLLGELSDPMASVDEIAEVIKTDAAMSFELLRVSNSAAYGYSRTISAIRDAVVIVGMARLRAWVALVALSPGGEPSDALSNAVVSARMCELLAARMHLGPPGAAFMIALLDGVADALGLAVDQLLANLPQLSRELVDALSGQDTVLRQLLDAARCYQHDDLDGLRRTMISHQQASRAYLDALSWSVQTTRAVTEPAGAADRRA